MSCSTRLPRPFGFRDTFGFRDSENADSGRKRKLRSTEAGDAGSESLHSMVPLTWENAIVCGIFASLSPSVRPACPVSCFSVFVSVQKAPNPRHAEKPALAMAGNFGRKDRQQSQPSPDAGNFARKASLNEKRGQSLFYQERVARHARPSLAHRQLRSEKPSLASSRTILTAPTWRFRSADAPCGQRGRPAP